MQSRCSADGGSYPDGAALRHWDGGPQHSAAELGTVLRGPLTTISISGYTAMLCFQPHFVAIAGNSLSALWWTRQRSMPPRRAASPGGKHSGVQCTALMLLSGIRRAPGHRKFSHIRQLPSRIKFLSYAATRRQVANASTKKKTCQYVHIELWLFR